MICQICQAQVSDDLVFCTECGSRLHESISDINTAALPQSTITRIAEKTTVELEKTSPTSQKQPRSLLTIATIIIAILAFITISGLVALVIFNPFATKPIVQNTTPKPTRTPTPKPANQNRNVDVPVDNSNQNSNDANDNSANENGAKEPPKLTHVIIDEQFNVDPDESIAIPFKVTEDYVQVVGKVEILDGQQFDGYVFLQEVYDEHRVDPDMKMFSFGEGQVDQYLLKGNYVFVFANNDGKGASLKAKFTQKSAITSK